MPPRSIPSSFYRGGTSRGLIFRASTLSPYPPPIRDLIIQTALGTPDLAGRQISGLGGGVSSLSKACILGVPGEGVEDQERFGQLPGCEWADDVEKRREYDVVYRFCQVGVKDKSMDWSATCGNMLGAVALYSLSTPLLPYTTIFDRARKLPTPKEPGAPLLFPLRILSASNGRIMNARVPLDPITLQVWEPKDGEGEMIAGVPDTDAAGIELEMPIEEVKGAEGGLVTGRPLDTITVDGQSIRISILTSGLPNVFVSITSLSLPSSLLASSLSDLNSHPTLPTLLEKVRQTAAKEFGIPISPASPKVTLLGEMLERGYVSSTGVKVGKGEADLMVRAVSSGDFHATIPGTTLGALNVGLGTPGTVINSLVSGDFGSKEVVTVRAGHAAGVASASVRFETVEGGRRKPTSVVMLRTAREIMRGEVLVPERVFGSGV